ncbi:uncharacterized protein LOC131949725 [Physella acuta]|uniref:uncharacterized protein LOC131949725 n=1 Tax=Physella acuta TaxID=109671 RepID=UPI0027DC1D65|nr:uncharacterized protein LOC131949725 [Physella acuta]
MKHFRCCLVILCVVALIILAIERVRPSGPLANINTFYAGGQEMPVERNDQRQVQHQEYKNQNQVEHRDYSKDPLAIIRRSGRVKSLLGINLENMTTQEMLMTIHSYPDNIDTLCERVIRLGKLGNAGWDICDDPDVRPKDPCIIYSYGINYEFSFDDDAAKLYGCHVFSFDPSMIKWAYKVKRSALVLFYKIGLGGETQTVRKNNWKLYTHGDIRKMLGHQNQTIDVIKMDIEWSEWEAIPEMLASGQLTDVRQFLVEYHVVASGRNYLLPRLKAMQGLEEAGFKRFKTHKNEHCETSIPGYPIKRTQCYEVHYVRR